MEPQTQNNFLTIPLAIVVAGIVIAGAIFFGGHAATPVAITQNSDTGSAAIAISLRPVDASDHMRGNPSAPLTLVEYSDLECPFCKAFHQTMQKLMDEYGKNGTLAWVYRHFPLDQIHPKTRKEAEGSECAAEQGGNMAFWAFVDRIFEITPSNNGLDPVEIPATAAHLNLDAQKFATCLASGKYADTIESDYQDGLTAGVTGTPFSILTLRDKVTATQGAALAPLIAQYGGGIALTADKTKITINGALPYAAIKALLDVLGK